MNNLLSIGQRFTFKGTRCEVTRITRNGFMYKRLDTGFANCYMDWWFYKKTPSYIGRQPQRCIRVPADLILSHRQYKKMKEEGRI